MPKCLVQNRADRVSHQALLVPSHETRDCGINHEASTLLRHLALDVILVSYEIHISLRDGDY
jgi:hypothetical protein